MTFSVDVANWAEKAGKNIEQVKRGVALDMFSKVIVRSPVDTGRFRGNWQTTINGAASGELEKLDPSGQDAINRANAVIASASGDSDIYMVNNLPYAQRLEFGWSQQAPSGMVRVTVSEFERAVNDAIRKLDK